MRRCGGEGVLPREMVDLLEVLKAPQEVRLEVRAGPHEVEVAAVGMDLKGTSIQGWESTGLRSVPPTHGPITQQSGAEKHRAVTPHPERRQPSQCHPTRPGPEVQTSTEPC